MTVGDRKDEINMLDRRIDVCKDHIDWEKYQLKHYEEINDTEWCEFCREFIALDEDEIRKLEERRDFIISLDPTAG